MQWRVIMALVLIGLILLGGLWCQGQISAHCSRVTALLEQTESQLTNNASSALLTLKQATALWESELPALSALLHHDRLERVGQELAAGHGALGAGDVPGCLARLHGVLYLLDDIREYDHINWKTLF